MSLTAQRATGPAVSQGTRGVSWTIGFLTLALLASMTVLARPNIAYAGVTDASPRVYTYTVVLVLVVVRYWRTRPSPPVLHVALVLYLTFGMVFFWPSDVLGLAGTLHYAMAAVAFWVGRFIGGRLPSGQMLRFLMVVVGVEFAIALVQVAQNPGTFLHAANGTVYRITGGTSHPGTLGKVALLLLVLTLPALAADSRRQRRAAGILVGMLSILVLLSLGRANILALAVTLALWTLLRPGDVGLAKRVRLPLLAVIAAVPVMPTLLQRVANDPDGGLRPELLAAGLEHLKTYWLVGSGPNSYVAVVGQFDAYTAEGYPVHNAALLVASEIGILGAVLLVGPLFGVSWRALGRFRGVGAPGASARALVAALPGLAIIALTGWGIAGSSLLPLTLFVFGYADGASGRPDPGAGDETPERVRSPEHAVPGLRGTAP